jgi:ATP dependent DNA ligase domain
LHSVALAAIRLCYVIARTSGHIAPCLPSPAERPPSGDGWIHEIKHDGFRIMARRDSDGIRLITRHGNDFTSRFPLAVAAVLALPGQSFLIDGEAIVNNDDGLAVFDLICRKRQGEAAALIAFDLIELDGEDLRRLPLEQRKRVPGKASAQPASGNCFKRDFRRGRSHPLRARLQARLRRHCVEAARLAVDPGS